MRQREVEVDPGGQQVQTATVQLLQELDSRTRALLGLEGEDKEWCSQAMAAGRKSESIQTVSSSSSTFTAYSALLLLLFSRFENLRL